jgi:hypothetical protein
MRPRIGRESDHQWRISKIPGKTGSKTTGTQSEQREISLADIIQATKFDADRIASHPRIKVDYELFAHFLDGCEASEEQKRLLAQMVWNLVFQIASLGFEFHPLQQAKADCGNLAPEWNKVTKHEGSVLK